MYIKELIIDGFKSYATRTVISGFDPQFNAITGLNGSGKSNILDAICFVLGLTTLSLARVNSLQELVYKFGHAGITKASVSIVFDNTDKKASPLGYESCDTIIITRIISAGKSKYLLNGHNESNQKIKNMFKTVQLNIDNPHFLVAQGKITKVINLRSTELISMLEETAGTSLYNEKKRESRKIIEKKEDKVREMTDLLETDIKPQMEKLRKEKELYYCWKAGQTELERFTKIINAYDYWDKKKTLETRQADLNNYRNNEGETSKKKLKNDEKISKISKEIDDFKEQRKDKISSNYLKLEEECKSKKKKITDQESELKNLQKNIKESEKDQDRLSNTNVDIEANINRLNQKLQFVEGNIEKNNKMLKEKKLLYEEADRNLKALIRGDSINAEDGLFTINAQIKETEMNLNTTLSEIKQLELKCKHIENELQTQRREMESSTLNTQAITAKIDLLNKEVEQLKVSIEKFPNQKEALDDIYDEKKKQSEVINNLDHKAREMLGANPIFRLNYTDPEPNFDRRKVKGRVFQLFTVANPIFIKPLEALAGGKLYQVVTDNEQTSKALLKNRSFQGFTVFIPNNKIVPNPLPPEMITKASQIASNLGGDAAPAYSLIKYDAELKPTMEYVFGGAFVCSTTEIAKRLAFDPTIRRKCINLEGDIFDPSGTLTGGYISPNSSIYTKYIDYKQVLNELDDRKSKFRLIEDKLEKSRLRNEEHNQMKTQLDLKIHEIELLTKQLKSNNPARALEKTQNLELNLKDYNEQIAQLQQQERQYNKELYELKNERQSTTKGEKQTKEILQEQVGKLKKEVDKITNSLKLMKNEKTNIEVDKENNENELKQKKNDMEKEINNLENLKKEIEKVTKSLNRLKGEYSKADEEKQALDKKILSMDTKIVNLEKELMQLKSENEIYERELKKLLNEITRYTKELKEIQDDINKMEKTYPWLALEYENFGISGSEYDFENIDMKIYRRELETKKRDQDALSKRVNMKVEAMSDKVEKEFKSLENKREQLDKDKEILENNIEELDKKKKEALEKCWVDVNANFGRIFSTLLPGAFAKIQPVNGLDPSEGLELKVAFNNTWKHSLSELSGGQRSLLALSFMLALLLHKPAPFYILDEIDAALDLSHTENIGAMISQHFPQSQFIIISLKEEMFNNANVLFKTSFVDGVSKVDRFQMKNKDADNKFKRKNKKMNEPMSIES